MTVGPDAITVAHVGGTAIDGIDTVRNVERLQFADQTVNVVAPGAPTIGAVTAGNARATVNFTPPAANNGPAITGFAIRVVDAAGVQVGDLRLVGADANVVVVTGLTNGSAFRFQVAASNAVGTGAFSALSSPVTPVGDTTPPTVTARTPAVNATGVAVAADITATFSENVVGTGATTVTVRDGANPAIAGVVTYNAATRIATLNPDAALANNTLYTVALTAGITDVAGNPLAATTWTFRTIAAAPVNPPPTVTARTPAIDAINVNRGNNITVRFSEQVTGVNGTTVTLQRVSNGNPTGIAVSISGRRDLTINPNNTLRANEQYRITLTGGPAAIRDLAGAPLATTSWTFTTRR